ncbi:MAG: hypothetical protein A2V67_14460 [Deltaproteobacteria bacterium RBG_13_61_14]|nr:MAG: hypothetical protein A2V67_14460 [Deltaproteobacteria bacterium RBG_13_61_14]
MFRPERKRGRAERTFIRGGWWMLRRKSPVLRMATPRARWTPSSRVADFWSALDAPRPRKARSRSAARGRAKRWIAVWLSAKFVLFFFTRE